MRLKAWWPVAAIIVSGLLATGLAFRLARTADEARIRANFDLQAEWRAKDIEHKIDVAAFPVQAAATFVASQKDIQGDEAEEFRQFVAQARDKREPIRSIAWIPRVRGNERAQFEAKARAMGLLDYRILEPGPNRMFIPAQDRSAYYPVLIHVGFEGQAPVIGVDMGAEPVRRGAVLRARDTGRGVATGRFGMLTLSDDDPSYLVAYPVYIGGSVPATVEERRTLFRGVVFGAFQLRRMLAAAVEHTPDIRETIVFTFGQADDPSPQVPVALYSPATKAIGAVEGNGDPTLAAAVRTVKTFDVMGQRWTLASGFSKEVVDAQRSVAPLAVLLGGLLLTAAVGAYVVRERRQIEKIQEVVALQTADLRLSNASLRSEAERREQAEAWLRDAIEAIPDGFGLYDANDRFVMCNRRFREIRHANPLSCMPGASFAGILRAGIECGEIPVPEEGIEPWIQKRLEARRAPSGALIQKRGERWLRLSEQRMRSGGLVAIHADITELKDAQAEAEAARVRMADWTSTATDWFWESDAGGNLTFLSDSSEASTGVKVADRLGRLRLDLSPGDRAHEPKWRAHLAANATHRPFRDFVVETPTIFARACHMSVSGNPMFDAAGGFVGYRGTTRDVTARVEAERALAQQTYTLSILIENLPIGVVLIDRDMRIVAYNQPYFTLLSLPPDLLKVGDPVEKSIRHVAERGDYGPGDIDTIARDFMERLRTPQPRRYETVHIDGRVIETNGQPLAGGGLISTFTDVTEKQRVERQFAQAQKMDAVGQLTGGIAHDFNNLLGIVVGNMDQQIDTLDCRPDAIDEIKSLSREALDAALRGAELVKRLLAFSRNQPLQPKVIDIGETVHQVEPLLWRALGEHVTMETVVAPDLWRVSADPNQLQNVIVNLAINARDAMPNGGRITIACTNRALAAAAAEAVELPPGAYVTLTVADTGTGIPTDVLPHVFEPFFTTKDVGKGSGLGLSMVYGYARQSGGSVRIASEVGRGTEVRVYLPRAPSELSAGEAAVEPVAATSGHERVLLVEDKDEVRTMASRLLVNLGYEVIAAESGVGALDMVNRGLSFDLLFTDIVMPGNMNGIELAHEVRRRHPGIPVLLTSGFSDPEMLRAEAAVLGVRVLRKPYRKTELAEYLRTALNRLAPRAT